MHFITMLIFLAILVSGCCADPMYHQPMNQPPPPQHPINQDLINLDTQITLQFFAAKFRKYRHHPEIVCKLVFVLQSIKDYHMRAEVALHTVAQGALQSIQHQYTTLLNAIGTDPSICQSTDGRQFNGNIVQDAEYSTDDEQLRQGDASFRVELRLREVITTWIEFYLQDYGPTPENVPSIKVFQKLYGNQFHAKSETWDSVFRWMTSQISLEANRGQFKSYRIMKVFILEHAMSLASGGTASRNQWRSDAANVMAQFDIERFFVCEAIILSLFQRRQDAITIADEQEDEKSARDVLYLLRPMDHWSQSITHIPMMIGLHLTTMFNPRRYPDPFRFPSSRSLCNNPHSNFQIFLNEVVSYIIHLGNLPTTSSGPRYAGGMKAFIMWIWYQLKGSSMGFVYYDDKIERFFILQSWESRWWIDHSGSSV